MQEGHWSSSSGYLKQLIAATLHSGSPHSENENNTVSNHLHSSRLGQCVCDVSMELSEDNQDIRIISSESDYWKRFNKEVCFNSGWTPTWEHTPRYLMEINSEEPIDTNETSQPSDPEYKGEGRLVIDTEAAGEYIEELHDDPLANQKDIKMDSHDTLLDLSTRMEAGEQSRQSIEARDNSSY